MNELLMELVEDALSNMDHIEMCMEKYHGVFKEEDDIFNSTCIRVLRTLKDLCEGKSVIVDLIANIRQMCSLWGRGFKIDPEIYEAINAFLPDYYKYGIEFTRAQGHILVNHTHIDIEWFGSSAEIDMAYSTRVNGNPFSLSPGDAFLEKLIGNRHYRGVVQKLGVFLSTSCNGGETILVCMPTGYGKSLLWQYPSFFCEGLTVCIVPTISLALDQQRRAQELKERLGAGREVFAYHSGLDEGEKDRIRNELGAGNVSLLYASPEAILNTDLRDILKSVADEDQLKRLVIDECHIVEEWGTNFRPDFQFLYVLRKELVKHTRGKLVTLLLSATLTERQVEILKRLFSDGDEKFIQLRADQLRDQLVFFVEECRNGYDRQKKVLDVLPFLRRPMILYFNRPEAVDEWFELLKRNGYAYMERFTGRTPPHERERIIKDWNENRIDIILATAAFGLGVDKKDIRTVVHCYIPESMNRFYQEVGRSGRDGMAAVSFWFFEPEADQKELNNITKSKIARAKTIAARWISLREKRRGAHLDMIEIDGNINPYYMEDKITGARNANWNEHIVLFLFRHGLVDIQNIEVSGKNSYRMFVKIISQDLFSSEEEIERLIENYRELERNYVNAQIKNVREYLKSYKTLCMGEALTRIYDYAPMKCQGCPACRAQGFPGLDGGDRPYFKSINIRIRQTLQSDLERWLKGGKELCLVSRDCFDRLPPQEKVKAMTKLITNGLNVFIVWEYGDIEDAINGDLAQIDRPYMYLDHEDCDLLLRSGARLDVVCIFYPADEKKSSRLYKLRERLKGTGCKVVDVVKEDLYLPDVRKNFIDIVGGDIKFNFF